MIIFAPSILYYIEIHNGTTQLSWFSYVLQQNTKPFTSHAWFILVLITFELVYICYWKFLKPPGDDPGQNLTQPTPNLIFTHFCVLHE